MAGESLTKEISKELADYIRAKIPTCAFVDTEWPLPNQVLEYPGITILTKAPSFSPWSKYEVSRGPLRGTKRLVKWCVGQYQYEMQLDLWARNKEERDDFYEKFFLGFNSQLQGQDTMGVSLQLDRYHGRWARYDITGYNFSDSEESAQRGEWRTIVTVLAHCDAIIETDEYAMITIENNPQLSNNENVS